MQGTTYFALFVCAAGLVISVLEQWSNLQRLARMHEKQFEEYATRSIAVQAVKISAKWAGQSVRSMALPPRAATAADPHPHAHVEGCLEGVKEVSAGVEAQQTGVSGGARVISGRHGGRGLRFNGFNGGYGEGAIISDQHGDQFDTIFRPNEKGGEVRLGVNERPPQPPVHSRPVHSHETTTSGHHTVCSNVLSHILHPMHFSHFHRAELGDTVEKIFVLDYDEALWVGTANPFERVCWSLTSCAGALMNFVAPLVPEQERKVRGGLYRQRCYIDSR
jgi:hypothetical protein